MRHWPAFVVAGAIALRVGAACDSSTSHASVPPANRCPPASVSDAGPSGPISFRDGVLPVFARSCSFESCHGASRSDRVRLGTPPSDAGHTNGPTPTEIRAALLERSKQSDLPLVEPFHSEESFLMRKLDGDLCPVETHCPDGCGEPMPQDGELLDPAKRETIRQWIAAGALDD